MVSQVSNIENISGIGFVSDTPSMALAPGGFSDVSNVRFDNNSITKVKGYVELFEDLTLTNIQKILFWANPNKSIWIVVNRQDVNGTDKDFIYAVYIDGESPTAENISQDLTNGYTTSEKWQGTIFNGGYTIILNPANSTPQHCTDSQGSASIPQFANLPNWTSYTADSTTVNKVNAGIVVAYGNLLIAGDLTEFDSSDNVIRDLRGVIRSSDVAAPGTIPQNWNPFAIGAGTADELIVANTGKIRCLASMQGKLFAYTSTSITQIDVTTSGLREIKITDQYGTISQDTVYEYDGRHIVIGSNDIYAFSGHPSSIESISDNRVRKYYFENVHGSSTEKTKIIRSNGFDELWICYRTNNNSSETLDEALVWNYRHNLWSKRTLPLLKDITIGAVTGGGVDTNKYTFEVTGTTGVNTSGTAEIQDIALSSAVLNGGTKEVQASTYSGTRSNVVGDQNEVYTITLNDISTGTQTPLISANEPVTSITQAAPSSGGTVTNDYASVTGLSVTSPPNKLIKYTEIKGNGGSPSIGTKTFNPSVESFSYSWHNRTFSGDQSSWGTSMVRETDSQVARCLTENVNVQRLGWRWTGSTTSYTRNPYYFKIKVVGKHRTSETGPFLTGTNFYVLRIAVSNSTIGTAEMSRRDSDPGDPGQSSLPSGGTTVESGIYYLYDLKDCVVEFYFNAYEPDTSSAVFRFYWDNGAPNIFDFTNNTSGNLSLQGTSLTKNSTNSFSKNSSDNFIIATTGKASKFVVNLDVNNSGVFTNTISGVFDANLNKDTAATFIKNKIDSENISGITTTVSNNIITIDTGQQSNLSGSYTPTIQGDSTGGTYNFVSQNGLNNPTFSTSYTITAPDGTQVSTFTSAVDDIGNSDLSTVLSTIQSTIASYVNLSSNLNQATVTTASPNIIITNNIARSVTGTWNVNVDHNNVTGDELGDITIGSFSVTTQGTDGESVTGNILLNNTVITNYTVFNETEGNSTNAYVANAIANAVSNNIDNWTASQSNDNLRFVANSPADNSDLFSATISSSGSSTPSFGTVSVTTNGIDPTIDGDVDITITSKFGVVTNINIPLSNKTQNEIATLVKDELDARDEFTVTSSDNVVNLLYTQFGDAAPLLEITYHSGTELSGTSSQNINSNFTFEVVETRDLERPWPLTFINENYSYPVGILPNTFYALDIGSDANGSNITSFIERKNINVSPTKDTENYHSFYLDTLGEQGSFEFRIEMTDAAGVSSNLTDNGLFYNSYSFVYGGDDSEYNIDIRENGRLANFRIQDVSTVPWSISGMGFEFSKGGIK